MDLVRNFAQQGQGVLQRLSENYYPSQEVSEEDISSSWYDTQSQKIVGSDDGVYGTARTYESFYTTRTHEDYQGQESVQPKEFGEHGTDYPSQTLALEQEQSNYIPEPTVNDDIQVGEVQDLTKGVIFAPSEPTQFDDLVSSLLSGVNHATSELQKLEPEVVPPSSSLGESTIKARTQEIAAEFRKKVAAELKREEEEEERRRLEASVVRDTAVPKGLDNLKNTCYMNSMLQTFARVFASPDLQQGIKEARDYHKYDQGEKHKLVEYYGWDSFRQILHSIALKNPISHSQLKRIADYLHDKKLTFGEQHEIQEAGNYLLEIIPKDLRQKFTFTDVLTRTYPECQHTSEVSEVANTLQLAIGGYKEPTTIMKAIEDATSNRGYDGEHSTCSVCRKRGKARLESKYDLSSTKFLVISPSRIVYNENYAASKRLNQVTCQASLTIGDKCLDLIAFAVHSGETASRGHYYAYVKRKYGAGWWRCDDDKTRAAYPGEVEAILIGGQGNPTTPALLFYEVLAR